MARSSPRGPAQALVEFAITVPTFLLLMFGLIDFSRAIFTYITLVNSTREMARTLSVPANTNAAAIAAFQDPLVILGPTNALTDKVTVNVYNAASVLQGSQTGACTLPLSTGNCTVPNRSGVDGGRIDVMETYTFLFAPQFKAPFGVVFEIPSAILTSTARAYIE